MLKDVGFAGQVAGHERDKMLRHALPHSAAHIRVLVPPVADPRLAFNWCRLEKTERDCAPCDQPGACVNACVDAYMDARMRVCEHALQMRVRVHTHMHEQAHVLMSVRTCMCGCPCA